MNPITDVLFSITWILLLLWAIRTIVGGWKFASEDAARPRGAWTTQVTKRIHPEMIDVEPGDQLMGVTFKSKEVTECDLEEYKDLQARIEELKAELEGDDEEEDDDGDIIVRV